MAFIVETGAGLADANAYVSVEVVDAYASDRANPVWVDALATPAKQAAIVQASDYIDTIYGQSFVGLRYMRGQGLCWPRQSWWSASLLANDIANGAIPRGIQRACAELAIVAAGGTSLLPNQTQQKSSVRVGPLTVTYDTNSPQATRFVSANLRIAPYLDRLSSSSINVKALRT